MKLLTLAAALTPFYMTRHCGAFFAPEGDQPGAVVAEAPPTSAVKTPSAIGVKLGELRAAFTSKQTLSSELQTANASIGTLTTERDNARAEAKNEKGRADGLKLELDAAHKEIADFTQEITGLKQERKDVSSEAREQLSKLGVPLSDLPASVSGAEIEDSAAIFSKWLNARGTEKQSIYAKHKDVIRAEHRRRTEAA